jgi:Methyltransferase domain
MDLDMAGDTDELPVAIQVLYRRYEPLKIVETGTEHRVAQRAAILRFMPPDSMGAEIGVFTGLFSEFILRHSRLRQLHLVDPWWLAYGELYPDWGAYTNDGNLSTRVAQSAAVTRVALFRGSCDVRFHVQFSTVWLLDQPDGMLDWAYLDSSHAYESTIDEITLLRRKVRPGGFILGDDWYPQPTAQHHDVFRAVNRMLHIDPYLDLVYAGFDHQYALQVRESAAL